MALSAPGLRDALVRPSLIGAVNGPIVQVGIRLAMSL